MDDGERAQCPYCHAISYFGAWETATLALMDLPNNEDVGFSSSPC